MKSEELKEREQSLLKREKAMAARLSQRKEAVFARFPLLFTLLGAFGLVATFYGFERLIDKIEFFTDNPAALLLTGILTLVVTGSLYKKLQ